MREVQGGLVMEIVERLEEGGAAKTSEGMVRMTPEVWAELEAFAAGRTDGYLVPTALH